MGYTFSDYLAFVLIFLLLTVYVKRIISGFLPLLRFLPPPLLKVAAETEIFLALGELDLVLWDIVGRHLVGDCIIYFR